MKLIYLFLIGAEMALCVGIIVKWGWLVMCVSAVLCIVTGLRQLTERIIKGRP